jgi:VWFA-related protein
VALAGIALPASRVTTKAQEAQAPQATFRGSTDAVTVEVAVRRQNRPLRGLRREDFEIRDNGVLQTVTDFSFEALPIDITVALDVSESVTGRVLDQLRRAVQELRVDLKPQDRIKLVASNMRIRQIVDFAGEPDAVGTAIASIAPTGSSAIRDTLAVLLATPFPAGRRQLLVLFSDGMDSSSVTEPATLLDVARRTSPTVAVVMASDSLLPPVMLAGRPVGTQADREFYRLLAAETGGVLVDARPNDTLSSTFRTVLAEFRASYVLHFSPTGVERGGAHTLDVKVNREGVEVRARREYIWR